METANHVNGNGALIRDAGRKHEAIYLPAEPEPVFAMASLPRSNMSGTTGVVMCPSFGWDDYCTHRVKRTWADILSDNGHPVIRFDLPGTGDSGGSAADPDRLKAWIAGVAAAAEWLRTEAGCSRVVGFGIAFGGMLAWAAAAEGASIDDLMLWATPTRGRRLVRELRAASKLNIDSTLEFESPAEEEISTAALPPVDDLLDEAGQVTTKGTLDSLSQLDLTQAVLPDAPDRRVLLFMRTGNEADAAVRSFFADLGADVSEADGDGYGALMQYVQDAQVPTRAITQSVEWLASASGSEAVRAEAQGSDGSAESDLHGQTQMGAQTLELTEGGVAISEHPIWITVDGKPLSGIVTEPVGATAKGLCAVFFSGGSDRRVGPNRMWVETSRRWAAKGVHAVRIDPPGIGDSDGDERQWDRVTDHYSPRQTDWSIALLDALESQGLPGRFILSGFCIGAYRSFQIAVQDRRIAGMFGIGMPVFFSTWWTLRVRDWWTVDWTPKGGEDWKKKAAVRVIQRSIGAMSAIRRGVFRFVPSRLDRTARALSEMAASGTEVLVLFKADSHELRDLMMDGRIRRLRAIPGVEVLRIPGRDTRFRPLALQRYISVALDRALDRVIARAPSDNATSALSGAGLRD